MFGLVVWSRGPWRRLLVILRQHWCIIFVGQGIYKGAGCQRLRVSLFWHCVAEHGTSPWFEYVPSAAQVADGISRGDFDLPARQGWDIVDLGLGDVWELLAAIINEGGMAQWQHLRKLQLHEPKMFPYRDHDPKPQRPHQPSGFP